jgi:hypothetical protein
MLLIKHFTFEDYQIGKPTLLKEQIINTLPMVAGKFVLLDSDIQPEGKNLLFFSKDDELALAVLNKFELEVIEFIQNLEEFGILFGNSELVQDIPINLL